MDAGKQGRNLMDRLGFPSPQILLQPNIPKMLHGLNPRTLKGSAWWDEQRQAAYARYDYRCWACGVHKSYAKFHHWLEGHEAYTYNWDKGTSELNEVVALCHACHNFIHSGRLTAMLRKSQCSWQKYLTVMEHGFRVLKAAKLPPNAFALLNYRNICFDLSVALFPRPRWHKAALDAYKESVPYLERYSNRLNLVGWNEWRLIIDGEEFKPLHTSYEDWEEYYNGLPE